MRPVLHKTGESRHFGDGSGFPTGEDRWQRCSLPLRVRGLLPVPARDPPASVPSRPPAVGGEGGDQTLLRAPEDGPPAAHVR